ncbi:MAG: hypothetical protein IV101_21245 [Dechloromonas sp.]|nr:hypothetical protein [Dechloromonas sp.]
MAYSIIESCMLVPGLTSNECASWVQSVGSIGAILASVWAVNRAHRLQAQQRARDAYAAYTQFLEVIFQLVGASAQVAKKLYELELNGTATSGDYTAMRIELTVIEEASRQISIERFDRYEFIEAWVVSNACVKKLLAAVDHVTSLNFSPQLDPYYMRNLAHTVRLSLDERAKKLLECVKERGDSEPILPLQL